MESIPSRVEAVLVLRISDINLMKHEALIAPVSLSQQERGPLLSSQSLNSFNCSGNYNISTKPSKKTETKLINN